jgi:hypothetical protein
LTEITTRREIREEAKTEANTAVEQEEEEEVQLDLASEEVGKYHKTNQISIKIS